MTTGYNISAGPSKNDWLLAFGNKVEGKRVPVHFTINYEGRSQVRISVVIIGLEWEDGSGECWNFKGHIVEHPPKMTLKNKDISGFYRTNERTGVIELSS